MVDLGTLIVHEDVDIPEKQRGRPAGDNPMLPFVEKSRDEGTDGIGRRLGFKRIPSAQTREIVNNLRYAVTDLGIGLRLYLSASDTNQELTLGTRFTDDSEPTGLDIVYKDKPTENYVGPVDISYQTRPRKQRKPKPAAEQTTDGTADDVTPDDVTTATEETASDPTPAAESDETETVPPKRGRRR